MPARSLLAVGSTLVLALALAGVSSAGSVRTYGTTLQLSTKSPAFHGKVLSGQPVCRAERKVKMFVRVGSKKPQLLGTDLTGSSGKWSIPVKNVVSGEYYAEVSPFHFADAGIKCLGDRSNSQVAD